MSLPAYKYDSFPPNFTPPRFPEKIVVDGAEVAATPAAAGGDDDDFFSSWDKPAAPKPATSSKPTTSPPPMLGKSATAPRTVSSASLRATVSAPGTTRPGSKLGASRLNSSPSAIGSTSASSVGAGAGAGPKKSKLGGLGAKKAAPVDFAEAERKAAEEAERIRQLGYDREREKAEEEARARQAAEAKAKALPAAAAAVKSAPVVSPTAAPKGSAQDMERLGMGMKRLGFGAIPVTAAASTRSAVLVMFRRFSNL